ncbi:MAG: PPE family protein [Mycobacterium sp.]|nr:PPE family protein [Mycobacterium sp.]
MALDFGALPPEINSTRMYTGPGSGPLMAAAAAFSNLADELGATASASRSAISTLTGEEWIGPSSTAMAAAAEPYLTWLHATAGQLQQAATQAAASAAAYEAAFAMTVPPALVAANRAQLAALVATNLLGQNTPAIAATEGQYGEMWAQDAAAMYGYAGSSASAGRLSPLTSPAPATNPGGLGAQAAAVSHAAASTPTSALHGVVSGVPNAVQSLAAPTSAAADPPSLATLEQLVTGGVLNDVLDNNLVESTGEGIFDAVAWNVFNGIVSGVLYGHTLGTTGLAAGLAGGLGTGSAGALVGAAGPAGSAGVAATPVLAGIGTATSVGGLSVPATWSAAMPETGAATLTGAEWAVPAEEHSQTHLATGMPAIASAGRGGYGAGPRYGIKPRVMPAQVLV